MRITEAEREVLRKNVKNMILQFKKSEIVNHFKKEGYKERTIYNTIQRMEDEGSLKDNLRTGRPPVLDTHQRKRLKIRPSSSLLVNSAIYTKECLEKRLLPFIEEFHIDGNYIFWPGLASAHYSNETQAWLRGKTP